MKYSSFHLILNLFNSAKLWKIGHLFLLNGRPTLIQLLNLILIKILSQESRLVTLTIDIPKPQRFIRFQKKENLQSKPKLWNMVIQLPTIQSILVWLLKNIKRTSTVMEGIEEVWLIFPILTTTREMEQEEGPSSWMASKWHMGKICSWERGRKSKSR